MPGEAGEETGVPSLNELHVSLSEGLVCCATVLNMYSLYWSVDTVPTPQLKLLNFIWKTKSDIQYT